MICTTIINKDLQGVLSALEQCEMAEVRLDSCDLSLKDIDEVFSSDVPLVATCRVAEVMKNDPTLQDPAMSEQSREIKAMQIAERKLIRAIEAGARYVDVEIEAQKQMSKRIRNVAHESGTVFIRSYHDFEGTQPLEELHSMVEKCRYHGADLVKLVTTATSQEDVDRVMSLYDWCKNEATNGVEALADGGLIAFCMGEAGKLSRVDCLKYGAPYTYAALSAEESAAPGQWPAAEMASAVYGGYGFVGKSEEVQPLAMPVSKSFAQRAIVAAALADGTSKLSGYTPCGDNEAALGVARMLGADIQVDGTTVIVKGISASLGRLAQVLDAEGNPSVMEDGSPRLHVGESGLLTRMMIPVMAQLCPEKVTFTGEKTLLGRALTGAKEILDVFKVETFDGAEKEVLSIPLSIQGPLKAGRADISGKHGSQLISGLLMALPFADRNSTLVVHEPKSIPYMFITLDHLQSCIPLQMHLRHHIL